MSLGVDRICVIIARTRHKMFQIELDESVKRGAKFIELRLDYLSKAIDFPRLFLMKKCPWVATIRRHTEGGRWKGTEEERRMILRQAIVAGFDWVDIETDIADEIKRFRNVRRIVSYHNFEETPDDIEQIHEKMCQQDADVIKIVTMAKHPKDSMRILNIIKNAKKPTVGHAMGEMGTCSRLLSIKMGAPFTYAAFNKERGIAPGLPSMEEVRRYFKIDQLNAETKVFGVVGDPVAHSFSPALHNQMFHREKINAIYLPIRVPRGELVETIEAFEQIPISGYSVTIPHKESAASIAKTKDERVAETKAANTLVKRDDGYFAANTDYEAALHGLLDNMPRDDQGVAKEIKECTVLILGTGGAARAVAHCIRRAQAKTIWIAGRTKDKVEELAKEVDGKGIEWEARHKAECDIMINCTPIGMHPNMDESPVHHSTLKPGMVVFDTVYNPEQTMLIKEARARGCNIVTGVEMFVRQAALQFEFFTGKKPHLEELREILRRALSPLTTKDEEDE